MTKKQAHYDRIKKLAKKTPKDTIEQLQALTEILMHAEVLSGTAASALLNVDEEGEEGAPNGKNGVDMCEKCQRALAHKNG